MRRDGHSRLLKNTVMLYAMTGAKMALPLVLLPYLTRVLSKECYGAVAFVKSLMMYAQILVDFGFMLSATKDIALAVGDRRRIDAIIGDVLVARVILCGVALVATALSVLFIPLLRPYALFTLLSLIPVFLSVFLFDYFFRGIEKMGVITSRFVLMRSIAVALTFFWVRGDEDLLMIPVLDFVGTLFAVAFVWRSIVKEGYGVAFSGIRSACRKIWESWVYFLSNMATTAFNALNTLVIGIALDAPSVAEWSVCFQCVTAAQQLYTPITDSLYPHMIKSRDTAFAKKMFFSFLALVLLGCVATLVCADWVILALGGEKYASAGNLLRAFVPLLFVSFPTMFFGWPMLGAIHAERETTFTTIATGVLQVLGLGILGIFNLFGVFALAWLRCGTEVFMLGMRLHYCHRYRGRFSQRGVGTV